MKTQLHYLFWMKRLSGVSSFSHCLILILSTLSCAHPSIIPGHRSVPPCITRLYWQDLSRSVTFLQGLLQQQARVVGLSRRPPVVFRRHICIIQMIKDGRRVQKSKVEWSNNGNGRVYLASLLSVGWPWDLKLVEEIKEEAKRRSQHYPFNPLKNRPQVVWATEHRHNKRADVNKKETWGTNYLLQNASLESGNERDGIRFIFIMKRGRKASARHDE